MRYTSPHKPDRCPACGSRRIADILYGYPAFSKELEADVAAGRVMLGRCCVTGDDPAWECLDCHIGIYDKRK